MTDPKPRGVGRPSIAAEPGERYQIRLPAILAERLKARGEGSLSRGILRVTELLGTAADVLEQRGTTPAKRPRRRKPNRKKDESIC